MSLFKRLIRRIHDKGSSLMSPSNFVLGFVLPGLATIAVTFVRQHGHSPGWIEGLIVFGLAALCVLCVTAAVVVLLSVIAIWKEGPEPSPLVVPARYSPSVEWFRVKLSSTAGVFILCPLALGVVAGGWAWNSADPAWSPEDLAALGPKYTTYFVDEEHAVMQGQRHLYMFPISTGFWVGSNGYMVSCASPFAGYKDVEVAVPLPVKNIEDNPSPEETLWGFAAFMSPVKLHYQDAVANLAVVRTIRNPFREKRVGPGGELHVTIPPIAGGLPNSGDRIERLSYSDTPMAFGAPKMVPDPEVGSVIGKTYDSNRLPEFVVSVPYKTLDCGAPVLNDRGKVIGIVIGGTNGESGDSIALGTATLRSLLKHVDLSY